MNITKTFIDQTAIITGGASGLGLVVAQRLADKGVRIALFDFNEEALKKAQELIGKQTLISKVNVADRSVILEAVKAVIQETGRVDILINCAGITGQTNLKSHEVDPSDFDRVMQINVNGCLNTSQAVIPIMLEQGYGRILHFSSIAGKEGNAGMLAYSTSKAAVIGMAKVQGKEYAGTGITINALAPAVIFTDMVEKLPPEQIKYMTSKIPMGRCGSKEEVAAICEFIVSPEASFTTGFVFDLTGGRSTY